MVFLFDTSGVNRLHDDPASEAIVAGLIGTNTVRVSALNVVEAARTPDPGRRLSLLRLLKRMTGGDRPLEMPNTLARRAMTAYSRRLPCLDSSIDAEADVLWGMLVDPSVADDETRRALDAGQEKLESEFLGCHQRARPHFQDLFRNGVLAPRRAAAPIRHFMRSTQFLHEDVVNPIYRQQTGADLPASEMDEMFHVAPEVAGFLLGWAHSIHQRSIALEGFGSRNAGIVDLWFATYLGRVDRFITADRRQYRALRLVARIMAPRCGVVRFCRFRRRLLGNL